MILAAWLRLHLWMDGIGFKRKTEESQDDGANRYI